MHAIFDPEISECETLSLLNAERQSHAGNWNILVPAGKENKLMIPLLAESEKGIGQAESPVEKQAEMWWDIISN